MAWWDKSGKLSYKDEFGNIYTVDWTNKPITNKNQFLLDITTKIVGPVFGRPPKVIKKPNNHNLVECQETVINQIIQVFGNTLPNDYLLTNVSYNSTIVYKYLGQDCVPIIKNPFKYGLNNALIDNEEIEVSGPGCWTSPDNPTGAPAWNPVGSGDNFWLSVWN